MKVVLMQFAGRGGMQLYIAQLANALSELHEVHLLIGRHLINEEYYDHRVKVHSIRASLSSLEMLLLTVNPLTYFNILATLRSIRPDIIHIPIPFLWTALLLPFLRRYPLVLTDHDPSVHLGTRCILRLQESFSKYLLRKRANHIIVHGHRLKQIVVETGIDAQRIHVIPHGEFSFYRRKSKSHPLEENMILYFGHIRKYKGLDYLIKALPIVAADIPEAKAIIAGEGDFSQYEPMIENQELFEIHNEFIEDDKVAALFERAAVVVLPYIDGSQSGIVPIAYAFGKPVVVTDVGSIAEVVDEGVTGLVVPPKDTEALAAAIIRLLRDDELRETMGQNASHKALSELSWGNIAKSTTDVYKEAIREKTNSEMYSSSQ